MKCNPWVGGSIGRRGFPMLGTGKRGLTTLVKDIFRNGEQGFFYDPNDLSTLFRDAAGTVPVTGAEQAVGLMLDKSKGLVRGAEKWVDSNVVFTGGSSRISTGTYRIYTPDGTYSAAQILGALTVGRMYEISFEITSIASVGGGIAIEGAPTTGVNTVGGKRHIFTAISPALVLKRADISLTDYTVTNISVKELHGNHAYQNTSAAQPILRDAPRRIDFDTVVDKLITKLPAQLSGCTVIRSVPNVGTQILTGQTIPATYEDNTDHCGLLVINRALTPSETSAITAELNKRAGV